VTPLRGREQRQRHWIYLAHLPLRMALQVLAAQADAPWWIEYPLLLAVASALLLASYHWLVRGRMLGRFLGERRPLSDTPAHALASRL
jgi:hypothetical protein